MLAGPAAVSLVRRWELLGVGGWVCLLLAVPELLLVGAFLMGTERRVGLAFLGLVVVPSLAGLVLLVGSLVSEQSKKLAAGQLLLSGGTVWLTNVIVFGLL